MATLVVPPKNNDNNRATTRVARTINANAKIMIIIGQPQGLPVQLMQMQK